MHKPLIILYCLIVSFFIINPSQAINCILCKKSIEHNEEKKILTTGYKSKKIQIHIHKNCYNKLKYCISDTLKHAQKIILLNKKQEKDFSISIEFAQFFLINTIYKICEVKHKNSIDEVINKKGKNFVKNLFEFDGRIAFIKYCSDYLQILGAKRMYNIT